MNEKWVTLNIATGTFCEELDLPNRKKIILSEEEVSLYKLDLLKAFYGDQYRLAYLMDGKNRPINVKELITNIKVVATMIGIGAVGYFLLMVLSGAGGPVLRP